MKYWLFLLLETLRGFNMRDIDCNIYITIPFDCIASVPNILETFVVGTGCEYMNDVYFYVCTDKTDKGIVCRPASCREINLYLETVNGD